MKKAMILGASGLVGGHVLDLLLTDSRYEKVSTLSRGKLPYEHAKLEQHIGNLFELETQKALFENIDDLFIAIGTTQAKTPDKKQYESIDYGIPVAAGRLAKEAGIPNVCVVSSMGANPKSSIFYTALKGRKEEAMQALGLTNLNIVRPSLLLGNRSEKRAMEKLSMVLMQNLSFLIPEKHKAIPAQTVAKAMVALQNKPHQKVIWMNAELFELAAS